MAVRFSPFSVDVFTEFPLALPPRESESGDLALVPVSPSPRKALRQWCGDRMGCSASMTAWAFGAVPKPTGRKMTLTLCHSKPPFVMIRISFDGCLRKSLCIASVDFPGFRAQTHIPSDRATIMADMMFKSMRRVSLSSW